MIEKLGIIQSALLLDKLASTGARWLWKSQLRDGLWKRLPRGMALLLVPPVLAIAITALGWLVGQPWKVPAGLLASLCPIFPLLYLGYCFVPLWRKTASRREGLAVFDETLDLKDRLQTAYEFIASPAPTPFMEAAIADAGSALEKAGRHPLDWDWRKPSGRRRGLAFMPIAATVLLVISIFLPAYSGMDAEPEKPEAGQVQVAAKLPQPPEDKPPVTVQKSMDAPEPGKEKPEAPVQGKGAKGEPTPLKVKENPASRLAGGQKVSLGTSGGGQTSQAMSSGRAGQSRGMPGSQAPSSSPEKKSDVKKKQKKPGEGKEPETRRKPVDDKSGATSGLGSSSGSSRNPAANDWSTKDRTDAMDNEEFEQEEDVNDEETESEARGGLQPSLRDRRPPVNRDLGIGFGNTASSDSNGRGGPGQRKKSRGVASLVLGVPVPDHVKGQPNPGRVKVNQERVQPQGEDMPRGAAEDRGMRTSPAGYLSERTLDASMRRVIREFFLKMRARDARSSENVTETENQ